MKLFDTEMKKKRHYDASGKMHELNTLMAFTEGTRQTRPILIQFERLHFLYKNTETTIDPTCDVHMLIKRLFQITQLVHTPLFEYEDIFEAMFIGTDICQMILVRIITDL